jgi:hypothetical protein
MIKKKLKKKKKLIKKEDMSFAQTGADSKFSRSLQNVAKDNRKDDALDDENNFVRMQGDENESDIELKLGDVYQDIFDDYDDEDDDKEEEEEEE